MLPDQPEFGSITSGGRYDNLLDQFSSQPLPAVGGSIGIDRLFDALEGLGLAQSLNLVKALVLNLEENLQADYLRITAMLRNSGINTEFYYAPAKLDKQFKYAETKGIQYAVILGQEERDKKVVKIKNLRTREQVEVPEEKLIDSLS